MDGNRPTAKEFSQRVIFVLLFLTISTSIMIVLSPWVAMPKLGWINDYLVRISVAGVLLMAALLARRSKRFENYWGMFFGLFIMTVAISLDLVFGKYIINQLGITDNTPAGWALPKLNEFFVVVGVIVIFTLLSGNSLGSIYIQKGNLKLGLIIGSSAFFLFVAGAIPMASLFNVQNLSLAKIIPLIPWILIFVLANGAMEELLFRGLFLRKLEPIIGMHMAIFLLAFVFTGIHSWVSYTADNRIFLAFTFPLALALGYLMKKTDSVWGSILLHAGMDIPIMLGIFSQLN